MVAGLEKQAAETESEGTAGAEAEPDYKLLRGSPCQMASKPFLHGGG